MIRSYMMLLVALSLSCCAAPQGTTAVAPTGAPSSASTVSSVPVVAAAPQANAIVRLEAPACAHRGFLCGSCAVDGVWGALWVADDCSLQCNKWCGNQPAASVPTVALPAPKPVPATRRWAQKPRADCRTIYCTAASNRRQPTARPKRRQRHTSRRETHGARRRRLQSDNRVSLQHWTTTGTELTVLALDGAPVGATAVVPLGSCTTRKAQCD